jgi:RNA-directed DNA polymerase
MGKLKSQGKSFEISKWEVGEAFRQVKANQGAPGVDGRSIAGFEADLKNNLCRIWNRMSSGGVLPSAGARGGDTEAAWRRHQDAGHRDRR